MKTIVTKEVEENISVKEVAEKLISELENDVFKAGDMVYSYSVDELLYYVYGELKEYDPTDEEVNEVYQLIRPKLEEIYNQGYERLKKEELSDFSARESILSWIASNIENLYFVTPEEVLDTILKNGVKDRH